MITRDPLILQSSPLRNCPIAGTTAVIATLRLQFAQTIALGVSLGDIFTKAADQVGLWQPKRKPWLCSWAVKDAYMLCQAHAHGQEATQLRSAFASSQDLRAAGRRQSLVKQGGTTGNTSHSIPQLLQAHPPEFHSCLHPLRWCAPRWSVPCPRSTTSGSGWASPTPAAAWPCPLPGGCSASSGGVRSSYSPL